jgi:SAM-dependent methyltransferase
MARKAVFGPGIDRSALSKFRGHGLEIGGPSRFFQSGKEFPIYSVAQNLDNVNYSDRTFWEGALEEGDNFRFSANKGAGRQFICEASDLSIIPACKFDFVASCHTLEHCANPIKALNEWRRVLKIDGWLALVLPHKAGNFDHRRRVTEFEHLLRDYSDGVTEDDETHLAEILEKHDLDRDPLQESRKTFEKWIGENAVNRGAHHHVFDPALAIRLVDHVGFEVVAAEAIMPFHIFIVAQRSDKSGVEKENKRRQILESCSGASPFRSDRRLARKSIKHL